MSLSGKSNINPKLWGPYFWQTFHFAAFGYPKNPNSSDISAYKTFYINFMKILPCDKCSVSSQEIINVDDLNKALISQETLIRWSYDFHDKVNKKLNKTSPSYETFKKQFQNRDTNFLNMNFILIIIFLLCLFYVITHYTSNNP
jgi:hypothetical protein